nr:hypothetical protein [Mycobacterium sp. UM_NZ2]
MIPQRGPADLPFVDEAWRRALEDQGWVRVERVAGAGVDVE